MIVYSNPLLRQLRGTWHVPGTLTNWHFGQPTPSLQLLLRCASSSSLINTVLSPPFRSILLIPKRFRHRNPVSTHTVFAEGIGRSGEGECGTCCCWLNVSSGSRATVGQTSWGTVFGGIFLAFCGNLGGNILGGVRKHRSSIGCGLAVHDWQSGWQNVGHERWAVLQLTKMPWNPCQAGACWNSRPLHVIFFVTTFYSLHLLPPFNTVAQW